MVRLLIVALPLIPKALVGKMGESDGMKRRRAEMAYVGILV